jgi:hypothetical protein
VLGVDANGKTAGIGDQGNRRGEKQGESVIENGKAAIEDERRAAAVDRAKIDGEGGRKLADDEGELGEAREGDGVGDAIEQAGGRGGIEDEEIASDRASIGTGADGAGVHKRQGEVGGCERRRR